MRNYQKQPNFHTEFASNNVFIKTTATTLTPSTITTTKPTTAKQQ
jgi:hypothetical protein